MVQPRCNRAVPLVGVDKTVRQQLIEGDDGSEGQVLIAERRQQARKLATHDPDLVDVLHPTLIVRSTRHPTVLPTAAARYPS